MYNAAMHMVAVYLFIYLFTYLAVGLKYMDVPQWCRPVVLRSVCCLLVSDVRFVHCEQKHAMLLKEIKNNNQIKLMLFIHVAQ